MWKDGTRKGGTRRTVPLTAHKTKEDTPRVTHTTNPSSVRRPPRPTRGPADTDVTRLPHEAVRHHDVPSSSLPGPILGRVGVQGRRRPTHTDTGLGVPEGGNPWVTYTSHPQRPRHPLRRRSSVSTTRVVESTAGLILPPPVPDHRTRTRGAETRWEPLDRSGSQESLGQYLPCN